MFLLYCTRERIVSWRKPIGLLHFYTMHEAVEHDDEIINETAARGYTACFRHVSNFDDRENPLFLCALLQLLY
jgi:hypothetical protein